MFPNWFRGWANTGCSSPVKLFNSKRGSSVGRASFKRFQVGPTPLTLYSPKDIRLSKLGQQHLGEKS